MFLTDLAVACRKSGLNVQEQAGWQNRGHGQMAGVGSVICHHTAGPATGEAPSLNVVMNGRPGLAGPLSHLVLGRSGTVYVVAAGLCSHTGATFEAQQGNAWAIGIEAEATGTSAWPQAQYEAYAELVRALIDHYGLAISRVFGHKEIASPLGRKIDPNFDMNAFRSAVSKVEKPPSGGVVTQPLDYRQHHLNPIDNQYGHVLSIRNEMHRLFEELRAELNELRAEGVVIDYDKIAVKVADILAQRIKD